MSLTASPAQRDAAREAAFGLFDGFLVEASLADQYDNRVAM